MTKYEKLLRKFKNNPKSLSFQEIEKILLNLEFKSLESKGSHKKFKHKSCKENILFAIHNNDCYWWEKEDALKKLLKYNFISHED